MLKTLVVLEACVCFGTPPAMSPAGYPRRHFRSRQYAAGNSKDAAPSGLQFL